MLKLICAEGLLSLFTSRDRALSIVGDLTEESRAHAFGWFSIQVLRTAVALSVRGSLSAPWRSLWVGLAGLSLWLLVFSALLASTQLMGFRSYFDPTDMTEWSFLDTSLTMAGVLVMGPLIDWFHIVAVLLGSSLLTGAALGRWASVRDMNGAVPLVLLWTAVVLTFPVILAFGFSFPWYWIAAGFLSSPVFLLTFYVTPVLVGSAIVRR